MRDVELLFENVGGEIYRHHASQLTFATERTCTPGKLTGTIPCVSGNVPEMGATVRLCVDGVNVFYGRVFSTEIDRWGVLSFTAYDSLRYCKNNFSNHYHGEVTVQQVIRDIAKLNELEVGTLADVKPCGRNMSFDNECGFDCISRCVETATVLNERILVFWDNLGKLSLSWADEMTTDVLIGDSSLATDYRFSCDIDDDTYNAVMLYREESDEGARAIRDAKDNASMSKWGKLILSEQVDDHMSVEQMQDKANKLLAMKNRPSKKMSITALGVVGLRAGMMINIHFPSVPDSISKRQTVILDSVIHNFENSAHTMELEVRTFWRDC